MPLPDIRQAATMIEEGRIEPARTVLQNILHNVPSHLSARVLLARIFEAEGDMAGALTMWKQAAYHGPGVTLIEQGLRDALLRQRFGSPVPIEPLPADHPLWGFDNVVMTPHTAGASQLRGPRNIARFCANLRLAQSGKALGGVVDKQAGF